MSRQKKRYNEALREVLEDVERIDFMERHRGRVTFFQGHWTAFFNSDAHCCHSGEQPSMRAAIDACRESLQKDMDLARADVRWRAAMNLPAIPSTLNSPRSQLA